MLNRFTGNAERKAGLVSTVALGRAGESDEIAFYPDRVDAIEERPEV